mmetsp:Transcript_19000/g.60325  ORF Transcript_19000/g.60325 Transcript_19000/m.60325 type:complete len:375 (+) Transcript_19000:87-1211(+)
MGVTAPPAVQGLAPPMVFAEACKVAAKKAAMPPHVTAVLGFSAGALIGLGALLMTCVGGSSPGIFQENVGLDMFLKGAVGLPAGLTLVVLTGAELFTSNVFTMLAGVMCGYCKPVALLSNWAISYVANLVGSVALAWLSHEAHTLMAPPQINAGKNIALMKVGLPFGTAVAKGILCNWLVCLAVWGALASPSISGKILAIFWPIAAFITLGFEHCVANMFLIPQGMLAGADISVRQFVCNNLIPVTLGNVIGAAVFVTCIHYVAYAGQVAAAEEVETDGEEELSAEDMPTNGFADKLHQRKVRGIELANGHGEEPSQARPLMQQSPYVQVSGAAPDAYAKGMSPGAWAPQAFAPMGQPAAGVAALAPVPQQRYA